VKWQILFAKDARKDARNYPLKGAWTMSYYFDLYRAPADAPPLFAWESNLAEPLGPPEAVQRDISTLLPQLVWHRSADAVVSGRTQGHTDEPIAVFLRELEPGVVSCVVVDAAPPDVRLVAQPLLCAGVGPDAGSVFSRHALVACSYLARMPSSRSRAAIKCWRSVYQRSA